MTLHQQMTIKQSYKILRLFWTRCRGPALCSVILDCPAAYTEENILVGYLYDQIEEFEPRAQVADITFEHDAATGRTIPIIYLEEVETDNE